eukprot:CAMPEP_0119108212 /NCGR_PEP_ID=MMETSP1180-20130426/13526_1 /TAXON_ID=3052 ORGANISM="Chlamydomonas cf sp, Strain CCMP681" /NCGR_SAMPLE_ID=MMETSP1180 /ASSEMBLY_ACC=CAM_ASM_000741 /LENGTH=774 /DNA_ID=CAMNT_0007093803 /DNA_START=23 /DNA_END=2347 /DNA_ORIENTATION=-
MADTEDIFLGPRIGTGGANPFAQFGKGAGFGIKLKKAAAPATTGDDTAPKKAGKVIKYNKDFLLEFLERYNKCPVELHSLGMPEIVVSGDTERDQHLEVLLKVAEEVSEQDWRRAAPATPAPAPAAPVVAAPKPAVAAANPARDGSWDKGKQENQTPAQPKPQAAPQPAQAPQAAPAGGDQSGKIVKAADVGLQAYRPGGQVSSEDKALRTMKGVLNKLTPEKFERLLQQLLEVITTAEFLKQTIALVFENAVEQPTFCAMYADLCLRLSKELPSFPPPAGSDKLVTFRQILLNTCQDEFEGTEAAREAASKCTDLNEREQAERAVKKRTLGNVRLISELYKQDMVKDWIMTTCMEDLLSFKGRVPPEHNIEAACEMITTAGMRLTKSDRPETKKKLEEVLKSLEKIGSDFKNVSARIRFVIKDVLDLKKSNWVPRREVFTAKKLDEVRAQAEAELGMISSTIASALPTLPASQQRQIDDLSGLMAPLRPGGVAEPEWGLFPPLRGNTAMPGSMGSSAGSITGKSALTGEYQAAVAAAAAPAPTPVPAAAQPAATPAAPSTQGAGTKAAAGGKLSEEELKRKSENLFNEYVSTLDKKEAVTCVRELQSPAWLPKLVEIGLEIVLNCTRDKDQEALLSLLVHLLTQGVVSSSDVITALAVYADQLEDISMDYPKATQQLGQYVGMCVAAGALSLDVLPKLLGSGDYGVDVKRDLALAAFSAVQTAKGGAAGLLEACTAASLQASSFLTADASLDSEAQSVEAWLESVGLKGAVPL